MVISAGYSHGEVQVAATTAAEQNDDVPNPSQYFHIRESVYPEDFSAAGLTMSTYVDCQRVVNVKLSRLLTCEGRLTGQLLADFRDWLGD